MLFAVTGLLSPSRLQSPSSCPVETIAAPEWPGPEAGGGGMELSGIEPLSETLVWIT